MLPHPQGLVAQNRAMDEANALPVDCDSDVLRIMPWDPSPHYKKHVWYVARPFAASRVKHQACMPRALQTQTFAKAPHELKGFETWRRDELTGASRLRLD